jgi:hypothetical protein
LRTDSKHRSLDRVSVIIKEKRIVRTKKQRIYAILNCTLELKLNGRVRGFLVNSSADYYRDCSNIKTVPQHLVQYEPELKNQGV